jgi:hypothetical protein
MTLGGCAAFPKYPGSDADLEPDANADEMWRNHWDSIDTLLLGRRAYEDWGRFLADLEWSTFRLAIPARVLTLRKHLQEGRLLKRLDQGGLGKLKNHEGRCRPRGR